MRHTKNAPRTGRFLPIDTIDDALRDEPFFLLPACGVVLLFSLPLFSQVCVGVLLSSLALSLLLCGVFFSPC